MPQIIDIHTHHSGPPKGGDPLGVGHAMRGQMVGKNMYSDFKGMPGIAYYELTNFQLQQENSHKAGITYRLMSNPFSAEVLTEISKKPSIDVCKFCNDEIAETVGTAPNDTSGLGTVNPLEKGHIKEAERLHGPGEVQGAAARHLLARQVPRHGGGLAVLGIRAGQERAHLPAPAARADRARTADGSVQARRAGRAPVRHRDERRAHDPVRAVRPLPQAADLRRPYGRRAAALHGAARFRLAARAAKACRSRPRSSARTSRRRI